MEEINEKEAFEEIKFLSWSADDKKFSETDKALLEELKVYEEFKSLIISGSYLDVIKDFQDTQNLEFSYLFLIIRIIKTRNFNYNLTLRVWILKVNVPRIFIPNSLHFSKGF